MPKPDTPTLDRRSVVVAESNKIGEFLDWLAEQGYVIGEWVTYDGYRDPQLAPTHAGPSGLLHRYFDIDPNAEEAELRALLEYAREQNEV